MWLRELVSKVLINPIIWTRSRHSRHAYHPTRGIIIIIIIIIIIQVGLSQCSMIINNSQFPPLSLHTESRKG
jgi:hypothetical protein